METELKKNLFIIGNGFDIAHGIPTKYTDFQKYIRSLYMTKELIDKSFSSTMSWRYDVPRTKNLLGHFDENNHLVMNDVLGFIDYCLSRSQNPGMPYNFYINSDWWSVEEFLGKVDIGEFFRDDPDEVLYNPQKADKEFLLYDIAECFKYVEILASSWAEQIDVSNACQIPDFKKLINCTRLLPINNDFCISFNYTPTLEKVYGFDNVIHIHGIAGKRVMMGHNPNINLDDFCVKNSIPEYCRHAAKVLLDVTKKDTVKHALRFSRLIEYYAAGVTDIYSYGFSFSEVDLPYISVICSSIDTTTCIWHLLDFDSKEKRNQYMKAIVKCGYKGKFETYHINCINTPQKKPNVYKEYVKEKKRHMGKGMYYLEQFIIIYQTINYKTTIKDWLLLIPRVLRLFFYSVIERLKRK